MIVKLGPDVHGKVWMIQLADRLKNKYIRSSKDSEKKLLNIWDADVLEVLLGLSLCLNQPVFKVNTPNDRL